MIMCLENNCECTQLRLSSENCCVRNEQLCKDHPDPVDIVDQRTNFIRWIRFIRCNR